MLAIAVLLAGLALVADAAQPARSAADPRGHTFYVSPSGDNRASGTSPATAWRTLGRVNRAALAPGSRILLRGGGTLTGRLTFGSSDRGTPANPTSVDSYGGGRATIRAPGTGVLVHDTAGIRLADLRIVGAGSGAAAGSGIAAVNDLPGDVKLPFLEVERVEVSGFAGYGVLISGRNGESGFQHVRIARVLAHDNLLGGIVVEGEVDPTAAAYAHRDVRIEACRAYGNPGVASEPQHTGDGIVLSDVERGAIEGSVAHDNGRSASGERGGPVGIWAWDADHVVIERNVSYRNRVNGPNDGGGFDLDGGVSNSVMQHNRSHDNDGAGYLAVQFEHAPPNTSNVIRHNTSRDDARENAPGAIYLTAGVEDLDVYGNRVSVSPRPGGTVAAVAVAQLEIPGTSPVTTDVRIHDNRFRGSGGDPAVFVSGDHPGLFFDDNQYISKGAPLRISWQGDVYRSVAAWRAATGQESPGGPAGAGGPAWDSGSLWA